MVQTHVRNDEAWAHGRLLQVGRQQFLVDRNPPTVDRVRLRRTALDTRLACAQTLARMQSRQCSWADEPIQADHRIHVLYGGGDDCCGRSNTWASQFVLFWIRDSAVHTDQQKRCLEL